MTCLTLALFVTFWYIEYLFECHKRHGNVEENKKAVKIEFQRCEFLAKCYVGGLKGRAPS